MATQFPGGRSKGMIERIKRLILSPTAEWQAIDAEPMTAMGIFTSWVVPLAAIGPIAGLIGAQLFGFGFLGVHYRPSLIGSIETAVIGYVSMLAGIFILALVIDALAPSFGGTKNAVAAMKVAAYSSTAALVVGIVQIMPSLFFLGLLSCYSLYLMWIGLPLLMKPPADKAVPYFAVSLVACVVVYAVAMAIAGTVTGGLMRPGITADAGTVSGTVSVPGLGSVDLDKVKAASERMTAASERMQADAASGHSSAVPADTLQAMLPATIAGFTRGDVETQAGGAAGISGSKAEARYTMGEQSFSLSVADVGAMGAVATLGGAMNLQSSKTTANGYEKTAMVDGSMVSEKWDNADHRGSYSTMVASRFAVDASGNAQSIDVLKQAVAAIDTGKLAGLAK
ncbi:Yip1 family protein [Sphingomonas sp. RT2P30]|uniref:Yip1 family protein n=1 Tax=Parasphingomonas halimpatiens TaxID=3096162 RepID=UPI002FCC6368